MFSYAWLIPLMPFLAFVVIVFFTNRYRELSAKLAIGAMFISFILAMGVLGTAIARYPGFAEEPFNRYITWMPVPAGTTPFRLGLVLDPLAVAALAMVTTVCLMIFIYSQGYMHGDRLYSRFFAYVSLFATGMLGLVISNSLFELFVFWEIMGLCSYLLIGFWFERPSAYRAGMKAFLTTRIGDVILLLGMVYLYSRSGSLEFEHVFSAENLRALAEARVALPLVGGVPVATLVGLLIFGGAVGKSAQFPLHVWLPDAMEGPTPVSALIHAATMVAAGVYLVARTFPIFRAVQLYAGAEHSTALIWVAGVGAFTALFASTIAIAQDDIKRVLAYSTISQLGYMIMALGVGAFVAGVFHLIIHAFFKALLFLGSGSVIHGSDRQDMMEMGGLRKYMPITFWTFLAGTLALAGIPPFAGFWSKDEILANAFAYNKVVWAAGTLAALLTAFYMGRQIFLTFAGESRRPEAHAHESPRSMTFPLIVLAIFATALGLVGVPEDFPILGSLLGHNPFHRFVGLHYGEHYHGVGVNFGVMGISVLVALLGLLSAYVLYGRKPLKAGQADPLIRLLGPVWKVLRNKYWVDEFYGATIIWATVRISDIAYLFDSYIIDGLVNLAGRLTVVIAGLGGIFDLYVIDGLVNLAGRLTVVISWFGGLFDTYVIDGLVNLIGYFSAGLGRMLRLVQTGKVQEYLLVIVLAVLMLTGLYLWW